MKLFFVIIPILIFAPNIKGQTVIKMEELNGIYMMPCEVNNIPLKFIFDIGASSVSISLTEAMFMLKNGYLSEDDFIGKNYYKTATGEISEGTKIILKTLKIEDITLYNVEASIVHNMDAPLLLGQSALRKLGKIEFDYSKNILTIKNNEPKNTIPSIIKNEASPINIAEETQNTTIKSKVDIMTSFTPSQATKVFKPEVVNIDPSVYTFTIFNRWGEIVFQTNDINEGWTGEVKKGVYKNDTYLYYIEVYLNSEQKNEVYKGYVTFQSR